MTPPDKMFRDKRIEFFLVCVGSIDNIEQVFLFGEDTAYFECQCNLVKGLCTIGDNFVCSPEPDNRHSKGKSAIIVKKPDEDVVLGHVLDALSQIICPMLKDGTIERMTVKITGEERKAPEGTWVLGGAIELPCSCFIYGNRKEKADVRGKLRKTERSLYGI